MKTNRIKTLLTAVLLSLCASVSAYDFTVYGLYYNIVSLEDLTCEITYGDNGNKYSGDIIIPETVTYNNKTLTVVGIGSNTFYECSKLSSVIIPKTVTYIDNSAFEHCIAITSITIPSSVTFIGKKAFGECKNLNDIIENGVLEIKFNNSSILFDQSKHEFFDNADVLELKAYLNYDTESNGNFSKLWSLNIEMFLDGLQISSINNDIEIDLICSTQENAKLQLNDNDIEFTLQNDNSISFKTNQLGNFVYGYENTDNTIIIVLLVCGSLLLISGIVCFAIFKWRRKKIKSTN